jgi:hypothetical protein
MSDREKYINEMARHLLNNNLALFIGAGFSRVFGYPSWGDLLRSIINEHELNGKLKSTSLFSFVGEEEFDNAEDINDVILEKLLGVDYLRLAGYIDHILESDRGISIHTAVGEKITKYEELRRKTDEVQRIIDFFQTWKVYLDDIITTNYDTNIEYCLDNEVSTIHRNLDSLNSITHKNKVFKIHGCINDIEAENSTGIIITEKDYNNFKSKNKYLFYKVYSFFTEKKIVFIGYSINDPNIRSLLNDVIEENDGKVGLQIYWVTRDKLKDLDKEYYEKYFKLKIIEEVEIVDFFKLLNRRINKNIELKEIVNAEIEEYSKAFIDNYSDPAFLQDIIDKERVNDVLQYFYNRLIEEEIRKAVYPYFTLLSNSSSEVIRKNKLAAQNILEMQNKRLFTVLDLIEDDLKVKELFEEHGFSEIYIESLIEFASGNHPFGDYAKSIRYLLKAYKIFRSQINQRINAFLEALVSNISTSCSDNTKYLGYDWRGLAEVRDYIEILDKNHAEKLIDMLVRDYYDEPRSLQLEYVIKYSSIENDDKSQILYNKLYEKQIRSDIKTAIRSLLRVKLIKEYAFEKTEEGKYLNGDIEVDYRIETLYGDVIYYTLYDELNDERILEITQEYNGGKIIVSINESPKEFQTYSDFDKHMNSFKKKIESEVDQYLQNKGIEPKSEIDED